jgi:hypothetical protein
VLLHFKCFTSRLSLAVMPMTSFYQETENGMGDDYKYYSAEL